MTGFGYEHDEAWAANLELFKDFTDVSRGVRRLGAAAVDLCHVAIGALTLMLWHEHHSATYPFDGLLHGVLPMWCKACTM